MKAATFALAMMVASAVGLAQDRAWPQEPTSFRSVPFGATEKEAKQLLKMDLCLNSTVGRFCSSTFRLADVTVKSFMQFPAGKFEGVDGEFDSGDYSTVRSIFIDKYGPPTLTNSSEVHNGAGATFNQETLEWVGPVMRITLSRFGSKVTEGLFSIQTQASWEAVRRDAEAKRSKAKDGL